MPDGYIEKVETRQDSSVKASVSFIREVADQVFPLAFQNVKVIRDDSEMITIPKSEYEGLTQGGSWVMPESTRQALKTVATMLLDLVSEEVK